MGKKSSSVPQRSSQYEYELGRLHSEGALERAGMITVMQAMDRRCGERRLNPSIVDLRCIAANMAVSGD